MSPIDEKSGSLVIIGGGFAGLTSALTLRRFNHSSPVLLLEPRKRFIFSPLLFELLSREVKPWEVTPTYSALTRSHGIALINEKAESINVHSQLIETSLGKKISYKNLIISTGLKSATYGISGVKEHAFQFRDSEDVGRLRKHIYDLNNEKDESKALIIVGGGPTGVELACKTADLIQYPIKIHLFECGEVILPRSKIFNQKQAKIALQKRGVIVHLRTMVISISPMEIEVEIDQAGKKNRYSINHNGVIWTAGSKLNTPKLNGDLELTKQGILVNSYLEAKGVKSIFAIGDIAYNQQTDWPSSAQLAIQQGVAVAKNISALGKGKKATPFQFNDRGEMLSLGIGEATITSLGITLAGPLAFHLRRMAYLTKMPELSLGIRSAVAWALDH